jgi:phage shock protein PspC (stress-responsive transcriptional regulator)
MQIAGVSDYWRIAPQLVKIYSDKVFIFGVFPFTVIKMISAY